VLLWGHAEEARGAAAEMELVTIESLVPGNHLLRKIHASIDLEALGPSGN
jgi:hypothetical protein